MPELSRRQFIELTVFGGVSAAAGLGCGTRRNEATGQYGGLNALGVPYVDQPAGLTDGIPQYFAATCRMCPAGCGLFVKTVGGRAVKVEGNTVHPVNLGKTCALGQASLQRLYNPDRLRFPILRAGPTHESLRTEWNTALAQVAAAFKSSRDRSAVLVDVDGIGQSPSGMAAISEFAKACGATVVPYSLIDDTSWRRACMAVHGMDTLPTYHLDRADVIVSFGANFLETWPSPVYYARQFAAFRHGRQRKAGSHGYFVFVGPRMSATAAKADEWIPCVAGTEGLVARAIGSLIAGDDSNLTAVSTQSEIAADRIRSLARRIQGAQGSSVAIGGDGLLGYKSATDDFASIEQLNKAGGSQCVELIAGNTASIRRDSISAIASLTADLESGRINTVLLIGASNPVFSLPTATGFTQALSRARFVGAIAEFEDETTRHAGVVLPARAFLEEWQDSEPLIQPSVTVTNIGQPVIDPAYILDTNNRPWMDTRPTIDILADIARYRGRPMTHTGAKDTLQANWRASHGGMNIDSAAATGFTVLSDEDERRTAARTSATKSLPVSSAMEPMPTDIDTPGLASFRLWLYPHTYWYDGRHANLPWLQETPDPMTAVVWNSWVEINSEVAHRMHIRTGDIVRITAPNGSIEAAAVPYPGLHPMVVAMPIGQGHTAYGQTAGRGQNPLAILDPTFERVTGSTAWNETMVRIEKVRDADNGYHPDLGTLVQVEDRPGGQEPEALQNLIHETAREWRATSHA